MNESDADGFRNAGPILRPPSVAIVGASERAKWPAQIYRNLRAYGFPGKIYPVNPRITEIWGTKCYPDLASLPEPPQHAIVIVPAPAVQSVLETGVAAGLKSATVYAAQIGEGQNPEILARGQALRELLGRSPLALCGPNCMGGNSLREKYFGYPNVELCELAPGGVALVTQSGGTLYYVARTAAQRGVKFSYLVSSGNEMGLDLADYVNYLVSDDNTRVIALFIEGIRRPKAFMAAAAKALKANKPILAIKTGKSQRSRDAAHSHTGAVSGDYEVFRAMCEKYEIVNCGSLEDLVETLLVFQNGRLPQGSRVGWVTTSGGTVDLLFDYLEDIGGVQAPEFGAETKAVLRPYISPELELKNPLDAGDPPGDDGSAHMCAAVAADANIDIVAWATTNFHGDKKRDSQPFKTAFEGTDKPFVGFSRIAYKMEQAALDFQNEVGFPFLQGLPATVRALSALAFYGARAGADRAAPRAPKSDAQAVSARAIEKELAKAGLPPPRGGFAASPQEAATAATAIGLPVALKISSPEVSHKTEVGGVRLNLRTAQDVKTEAEALSSSIQALVPQARIEGFQIQEMVSGVEMIVGARTDPLYGPMILVGAGGVFVEVMKDVSIRLLPIELDDAHAMLRELKAAKLLGGFRGRAPADVDALARAILGLANVYLDHRDAVAELEVNPLIVLAKGEGVRAVDVRMAMTKTD